MAEGCPNLRSDNNPLISSEEGDLNAICPRKYYQHLVYDGTRLKWTSNLEILKDFLKYITPESGNWSSPGGTSRTFTSSNSDLSITWYHNKQKTLLFQGRKGDNLETQLTEICKKTALEENMADNGMNATFNERGERVVVNLDATTRLESDVAAVSVKRAACNCACSSAIEDIQDMELNMQILRSRVEVLQSLANANEVFLL